MTNAEIKYCNVDRLFYIHYKGEAIHSQKTKPTDFELLEALMSDAWQPRFNDMRERKTVRVSDRIYYDMLGSVPPIKHTSSSFYSGECYSGNLYYFFWIDSDGKRYGKLKTIN